MALQPQGLPFGSSALVQNAYLDNLTGRFTPATGVNEVYVVRGKHTNGPTTIITITGIPEITLLESAVVTYNDNTETDNVSTSLTVDSYSVKTLLLPKQEGYSIRPNILVPPDPVISLDENPSGSTTVEFQFILKKIALLGQPFLTTVDL